MNLDAVLKVWALVGGGTSRPPDRSRPIAVDLMAWGVSRASAYRWAAAWRDAFPNVHPSQVGPRELRGVILRDAGRLDLG